MAFQGSLAELQLPDIIQLVSVSGKTGVFHLVDGRRRGQIWLHEGRIVHAETEDSSAEEAVYSLAIWRTGEFRFEPGIAAPRHTIQKSNTNLLMEAARRLDEWRVLSKKIPSVDLVPEFVILDNREGQINLNTMEWLLLSKIDGQRTVKQIATAAGMGVFDAAKLLYGLVATNLIRLREQTPAPQPAAAGTPGRGTVTATVVRATAVPEPAGTPARGTAPAASAPLLAQLARVHDECVALLGPIGETVVQKHYNRARAEIERGAGPEAIEEAVQQIARAAGILKGSAVAEAVMRLTRG
ncbi:MAG TPA: DUF4388 domain-containing protein [Vicinamibacteria bacterium]|nr:DUF4388 domain-containing protein [Vicinamibacteria bacterium]